MSYPSEITKDILDRYADIPDEDLATDIKDTKNDLKYIDLELQGLRLLLQAYVGLRDQSKERVTRIRIAHVNMRMDEMGQFLGFIERLQDARNDR